MKRFALLLIILVFSGCAQGPVKRMARLDLSEYEPFNKIGTSSVSGQAFLKTVGGDVKFAAGNEIWLQPKTAYTSEWFNAAMKGIRLEDPDYRAPNPRTVIADGSGNFEFKDLVAGDYYLVTNIVWQYPGAYGVLYSTGASVGKAVSLKDGQSLKVILTR